MDIRVLSFDGCPNARPAIDLVNEVVRELGVKAEAVSVEVRDDAEAARFRFLGSPTVQIDGKDIEAGRRTDAPVFGCRLYTDRKGRSGVPPRELIIEAIREVNPEVLLLPGN